MKNSEVRDIEFDDWYQELLDEAIDKFGSIPPDILDNVNKYEALFTEGYTPSNALINLIEEEIS